MDNSSGIKFGDLKKEECYKRLERNLKLAFVQQMEQAKVYIDKGYCTSPTWPSLSTINADNLDTSVANSNPSLQVSRVESEVVSSSSNLHKLLTMKKGTSVPVATSSVKKFPINDVDKDRAIMPPPPPANLLNRNRKSMSGGEPNHIRRDQHNNQNNFDIELHNSPIQKTSSATSSAFEESNNTSTPKSHFQDSKRHRTFHRWKVLLNDQGQLIIKGILDCGGIARSKPVIQRLSSNKVLSVFKHIYILEGNIVDDRNELPDYVRGKFHNGFPDDWENVHQLWRNYKDDGCKVTFRWPTPIADSDDDLITEITDVTYCKKKQISHKELTHNNHSSNNITSSGYHSKTQSDSNQNLENEEKGASNIYEACNTDEKRNNSVQNAEVKKTNVSKELCDNSHVKDSFNISANSSKFRYTNYLHEIIKEDKLHIIRSKLADKNSSPEYLDKFIELIDCLRYLLPLTSINEIDSRNQSSIINQLQGCQKCNSTASLSETQETNQKDVLNKLPTTNESVKPESQNQNSNPYENSNKTKNSLPNKNQIEIKTFGQNNVASESSDSDAYMGIPNVPINRVFQSKSTRHERYRDIKNRIKDRKNTQQDKPIEPVAKITVDQNQQNLNDSSISITEDEYEMKHKKKQVKASSNQFLPIEPVNNDKSLTTENKANPYATNCIGTDFESESTNVKNIKLTSNKRPAERTKPVIKSNELVNIDLKSRCPTKNQLPLQSDISFLEDEVSVKRQKLAVSSIEVYNNDKSNEDKTTEDLLQHRFLTYDSDEFPGLDDEIEIQPLVKPKDNCEKRILEVKRDLVDNIQVSEESTKCQNKTSKNELDKKTTSPSKRKKTSSNDKKVKSEPFGSKENPKLLTSWVPCVMYDDELKKTCSLKFEGKLLNEAGHTINRKYITDAIVKRHSPTLIQTASNEYFILVGEVNNTKHVVPKELLKQCRTGCPPRIKSFCEKWEKLNAVLEKPGTINLQNTSIDLLSVPTSSRGRRLLPALNYWDGERVMTKDQEVLYDCGDVGKSSLTTKCEEINKCLTPSRTVQNNKETNVKNDSGKKSSAKRGKLDSKSNLNSTSKTKRSIVQRTRCSENDLSENELPVEMPQGSNKLSSSKKSSHSGSKGMSKKSTEQDSSEKNCNTKLRKRAILTAKQNTDQDFEIHNSRSRFKKPTSGVIWTYEQQQNHLDVLSDDQSSIIK